MTGMTIGGIWCLSEILPDSHVETIIITFALPKLSESHPPATARLPSVELSLDSF